MTQEHPITPPPPHLLKKFSGQAREESNKRNGAGYLKTFARLCIEWVNPKSTSSLSQIRSSDTQPPPYLLAEWLRQACECSPHDHSSGAIGGFMAYKAAQWGADKELESCVDWIAVYQGLEHPELLIALLRAARRPGPPSMNKQALYEIDAAYDSGKIDDTTYGTIRRALEAIDD
jgi:hypothetical protein